MKQSPGCLGTLVKLIAGFLAFLVVITLPISLFMFDVGRVIFSPAVISEILATRLIESGYVQNLVMDLLLSPELFSEFSSEELDIERIIGDLSPDDRDALVELLLPPNWMAVQVSNAVTALDAWLENDRALPMIRLDLRPIKKILQEGGADQIVNTVVDSWPTCNTDQIDGFRQAAVTGEELPILFCEPPEPFRERLTSFASGQLMATLREIPAELPLIGEEMDPRDALEIERLKDWIRLARAIARSAWLIPVALLGLIMALVIRSWLELGRWWGVPLLIAGFVSFILVGVVSSAGERIPARLFSEVRAEAGPVYSMLVFVFNEFSDVILGSLFLHATIVGGIGLALIGVAWWFSRRQPSGTPAEPRSEEAMESREEPDPSPVPPVSPMPGDEESSTEDDQNPPVGMYG